MPIILSRFVSWIERTWNSSLTLVSRVGAAVMSARGLAVMALVGCGVLVIGPWLRPAVSRDFRAIHIPWTDRSADQFVSEVVAEVPRAWRWDSLAVPLIAVLAIGFIVILWRPQWTSRVFGLLLVVSIPAVSAAMWNHPELIEFMEGEIRERAMLRVVYRQRTTDAMTNLAPDRLRILGEKYSRETIEAPSHPIVAPFRFSVWGPWLIATAFTCVLATHTASWPRRYALAGSCAGVGVLLALIVTGPRWVAEYHFARAEAAENASQYEAAEQSLQRAVKAMPQMAHTSRYWLAEGRLTYRRRATSPYSAYFVAQQYLNIGRLSRARAEMEHSMQATGGTTAERVLLAEIVGQIATQYALRGKYGNAEVAWAEATEIADWKPAYWIGEAVTILAGNPERAAEVKRAIVPRMSQVGDCFVSSDLASMLGDAYFAGGKFHDARDMYSVAMDLFNLPKYVNLHAQQGRLGM